VAYTIEQDDSRHDRFREYTYRIYKDGRPVALYWHDYRGHGVRFVNGASDLSFTGCMVDFIEGGGPEPLTLTQRAMKYLDQKLGEYKIEDCH
jgi:hypothetical protein